MEDSQNLPLAPTRARGRPGSASKNKFWNRAEDAQLFNLVTEQIINKPKGALINWFQIASFFPSKAHNQVIDRWEKVLDPSLLKGSWTRQEDETIISFVNQNGRKHWSKLANLLPGRLGKQVRERWVNHLDPSINRGPFTQEEDLKIIELHKRYGNHWSAISTFLPSRSHNAIKNRWNSCLSKKIETAQPSSDWNTIPPLSPLLKTAENQENSSINQLNLSLSNSINSPSKINQILPTSNTSIAMAISNPQIIISPQFQSPEISISPMINEQMTPKVIHQSFSNVTHNFANVSPAYFSPMVSHQNSSEVSPSISIVEQSKCDNLIKAKEHSKAPLLITDLLN